MQSVIEKFKKQETIRKNPLIIFLDIDATISTYSLSGVMSNIKTSRILRKNFIPFILITGRPNWYWFSNLEIKLYGLHKPDAVITGNGTSLIWKNSSDNWEKDSMWNNLVYKDWNREILKKICSEFKFIFPVIKKTLYVNKPLLLYRVINVPTDTLFTEIERFKKLLPKNLKVEISESLLFKNTDKIFSGGIFVVPEICGKAGVVKYVIDKLIKFSKSNSAIKGYLFGDASIDISMLSLKSNKKYILKSYLVNPTPLAKKEAKKYPQISISINKGPGEIFKIINSELRKPSPIKKHFLRKYFTEPNKNLIDKIYPQGFSANDITLDGLKKIIQSINTLYYENKASKKIFLEYTVGLLADVADGIRARKRTITENGHLIDVFADRAREFYQLYVRGSKRLKVDQEQGIITLEAALSCILPTFAKSQVETIGGTIEDNQGTTLWRTRKLFLSLIYDTILNNSNKSFRIDKEILKNSQTTFHKRLNYAKGFNLNQIYSQKLSINQIKALERLLLYIELLQEADKFIKSILSLNMHTAYNKWINSLSLNYYLESVDVQKLRKKFGFKNYDLYLKSFMLTDNIT